MAKKFKVNKLLAKPISYGPLRKRKNVKYIVIHNTGNSGDTAKNNAAYFNSVNTRQAGAHFFVDQNGEIYKSVNMNRTAWSVGGFFTQKNGAGMLYQRCTNANSISIELCDIMNKEPSEKMIEATNWLIHSYIRKYLQNASNIIRHWDVNGKDCPMTMIGTNNKRWNDFLSKIK